MKECQNQFASVTPIYSKTFFPIYYYYHILLPILLYCSYERFELGITFICVYFYHYLLYDKNCRSVDSEATLGCCDFSVFCKLLDIKFLDLLSVFLMLEYLKAFIFG